MELDVQTSAPDVTSEPVRKPVGTDFRTTRPPDGAAATNERLPVRSVFGPFESALRARNRSPRTIRSYVDTAAAFAEFCESEFELTSLDQVSADHVNCYIADQLAHWTPSTAATRFRCLQQFFRYIEETAGLPSPMVGLKPPKVSDAPVPVLRDHELVRLLEACRGDDFREVRDRAMLRLFIDAGLRRDELAGIHSTDVDHTNRLILIRGKGGQLRFISYGAESDRALSDYLIARDAHSYSSCRELWLGLRGPLTGSGIAAMVNRRAADAGVEHVFPHRFRHTFAHRWLVAGGNETDLQTIAGWRSGQMLLRYGASARAERAALAHRRIAPGDSLRAL
jgi:site-specific recombinase XerD